MTHLDIAKMQLDGMIAGMTMNSETPVQLSELVMLRQLLDYATKPVTLSTGEVLRTSV
jgi:hypothetical protein